MFKPFAMRIETKEDAEAIAGAIEDKIAGEVPLLAELTAFPEVANLIRARHGRLAYVAERLRTEANPVPAPYVPDQR